MYVEKEDKVRPSTNSHEAVRRYSRRTVDESGVIPIALWVRRAEKGKEVESVVVEPN